MTQEAGRREVLRGAAAGLLALGAAPWLVGCKGVVREELADPATLRPAGLSTREAGWLGLAALAPSGHNAQPWSVRVVQPGRWVIGSARERWLPAVDPENRELALSIGAFVENLALAVGTDGYRLETVPLSEDPKAPELLEVRLRADDPRPYPVERLRTRCVFRAEMDPTPLRAEHWTALRAHAPGRLHYFPPGGREAARLDEATLEANRVQAGREEAQRELAQWIRWSDTDARTHRNGLTTEAMGIHGVAGWYVRTFYGPEEVLSEDFRRRTVERVAQQVARHGGWIVVTSRGPQLAALLDAGRVFERLSLEVRGHGLALHPMSQALEEAPWREHMAAELGLSEPVQFLLRVGYVASHPLPVSLRMPLTRIVTT